MKYPPEKTEELLAEVEKMVGKSPDFSPSDVAALHEMMQAWRGWVALGRGAKWVITVLGLIAAAVASWSVLAKALKGWLTS